MMHGPCGAANDSSPCMDGTHCTKFFPKKYKTATTIDDDGYPQYKRRNAGVTMEKMKVNLDNGSVVPYNPFLLMRYQGHINVEYCNKSNAIKIDQMTRELLMKSNDFMTVVTYLHVRLFGEHLCLIFIKNFQLLLGCLFIWKDNNQLDLKIIVHSIMFFGTRK
jgi:hypothetical protein